jgi:hypothetical protein
MIPHAASNIPHRSSALDVTFAHRFFVGRSNEPAFRKALC